jgi:hypothetical protein
LPAFLIVYYHRHARIKRIAVLFGTIVLTLFPWFLRNYFVFHRFPPLSAGATGTNLRLILLELNGGEDAVRNVGLNSAPRTDIRNFTDGKQLIDSEKATAEKSLQELRNRWPEYLLLVIKHIPRLWITKYSRWQGNTIALLGTIISWVVLVGGIAGMLLLWREKSRLLPLYLIVVMVTLIYAPYTAEARYTMPVRPVMLCFLACAVIIIFQRIHLLPQQPLVRSAPA